MLSEFVSEVRYRFRALFRRAAMERELAEELEFHVEREARKHVERGLPPEAARRQARLAFGGIERIKDDARDARGLAPLEGIARDLRFALRGLRASPAFTAAVVLTLGLGLGANAAMFGVVDRLLFRPPAYLRDADHVHRVYLSRISRRGEQTDASTEYTRYRDLARWSTAFSAAAAFSERLVAVGAGDGAREMSVGTVSASYWSFFDAPPALGRYFTADEDSVPAGAPVVVLSYPYWQTAFGGRADVLGTTVQVGALTLTVIGVTPEGFNGVDADRPVALWVPITTFAGRDMPGGASSSYYTTYNWGWLRVLVRRKPGVTAEAASADLTSAYRRSWEAERVLDRSTAPLEVARPRAAAAPVLVERGPQASPVGRVARWVSGVALIVLLIACANTANLMLGRALKRRREFALRVALGVSRGRLVRQLLTESLLLAALGGLAGLCVAQWGGSLLSARFLPDGVGAAAGVMRDGRTLLFAGLAVLAAGVLTGLLPALRAGRGELAAVLKTGGRGGTAMHHGRTRTVLLVLQGALSVVLLVGAGLFVRSLWNVRALRLGYDVEPVMLASVNLRGTQLPDEARQTLLRRLQEEAAAMPGVESAARAVAIPFWSTYGIAIYVPGIDSVRKLGRFTLQAASPEYFAVMGTRILRGRAFTEADRGDAGRVIVVSQSMGATLWPGRDPLGQCVRVRSDTIPCSTVIGVAEDIKQNSLSDDPGLNYYIPLDQYRTDDVSLFVRTRGAAAPQVETVRR
ncbi:MAG TPA: ABC transporter permease, partial [Gemmatimonadaceae bacterium]|nr:ABC transporter permease [Gemmatimonadaceae bacterium]